MSKDPVMSETPGPTHRLRIVPELVRGNLPQVLLSVLLALAATAATLGVPLLVKELIEAVAQREGVAHRVAFMAALAVGSALASAASAYLLARLGERFVLRLRARVMEHTLRLPLQVVKAQGPGNLVARITSDAMLLRSVIDVGVVQLPVAVVTALVTIGVMAYLDWVLVLLTLGAFVIAGAVIWLLLRRVRQGYESIQIATGGLAQRFTTTLTNLTTIKAYRAERHTTEALTEDAAQITGRMLAAARLQSAVIPVMSLGQEIALAGIVIVGGVRITQGDLTLADFVAFLLYLLQLVTPITVVVTGLSRLQTGLAAKGRFEELLAIPVEPDFAARVPEPVDDGNAVAFEDVSFSYDGPVDLAGRRVLNEVTFRAPRRGLTALVGHSGAGKSTALALIERFVSPTSGRVTVLGHDAAAWPLDELRRRVAYVDQTFTLVEGSVRENLLLGAGADHPVADETLWAAVDAVGLTADIAALPHGLDTTLGREVDVSGGQRQRIALARALLSDAEVILLDEPTSQLDGINELRLRDLVDTLARDRAVLVVAHRLSTVQHADHVVVMDGGRVAATGSHPDLMDRSSHYRDLVRSQQWLNTSDERVPA
ncbi:MULTISPECIES: ABC transporter ATP-binding protein [unclassified Streptomyces]|uniref:ABC transporter ATP-binding protein n=1 Tax=unclassified Streptomyces TaxID=2593676 RepID=UPI002366D953|nr:MULTISPECIES: ABC transporter ATP-binding protein [unclassified Streptomyces]MDF3148901.1 ABC transporter ATP-binding protein [Streptomyces sp. T21Q-yed]WDF39844.1 ABC transporter ATP-binding protein [Streptomyces sp. T12]